MSAAPLTRSELAGMIDHTLLAPEATADDVVTLCRQAQELSVWSVCVSPSLVSVAAAQLAGTGVRVSVVIGFPSGAHHTQIKRAEAVRAVADGADELDMVMEPRLGPSRRLGRGAG